VTAAVSSRGGHGDVSHIAWRQRECDRSPAMIGQAMDFARSSSTRDPNRLRPRPPFWPWAERWAFTWTVRKTWCFEGSGAKLRLSDFGGVDGQPARFL